MSSGPTATDEHVRRIVRGRDFEAAIREASRLGSEGDAILVQALAEEPTSRRTFVVDGLAHTTGPAGAAALRSAVASTGPRSRDLRWTALIRLAVREQEHATDDLVAALDEPDLLSPALWSLAMWSDDRGWNRAMVATDKALGKRPDSIQMEDGPWDAVTMPTFAGVLYLLKHADAPERRGLLLALVRRRWDRIGPVARRELGRLMPELRAHDGGSGSATVDEVVDRLRTLLAGR